MKAQLVIYKEASSGISHREAFLAVVDGWKKLSDALKTSYKVAATG